MADPEGARAVRIRRLAPDDVQVLALLAREDSDFDLEDQGRPRAPLGVEAARALLSDRHVLVWAAWAGAELVGFLFCHVLPMRKEPARELLLYEIGVRTAWRRRGVGRRLLTEMRAWMKASGISTAWVLAGGEDAERFYRACGFGPGPEPAAYLELRLAPGA